VFDRVKPLWAKGDANGTTDAAQMTRETRRNRQKNLKASPACIAVFAHLARVSRMSEAALFKDMVAQRAAQVWTHQMNGAMLRLEIARSTAERYGKRYMANDHVDVAWS
jgi:hypothetical protein